MGSRAGREEGQGIRCRGIRRQEKGRYHTGEGYEQAQKKAKALGRMVETHGGG